MIAAGDRAGRIVLLKRLKPKTRGPRREVVNVGYAWRSPNYFASPATAFIFSNHERRDDGEHELPPGPEFGFWAQFQSHAPEFDYLKSMDIEEKVSKMKWLKQVSGCHRMVATNDKTIKLWRIQEKDVRTVATFTPPSILNSQHSFGTHYAPPLPDTLRGIRTKRRPKSTSSEKNHPEASHSLELPRLEAIGRVVVAIPRRVFSKSHYYHINSVSLSTDELTMLSADDLRLNLWHLDHGEEGFNILDLKPTSMDKLTEVMTSAEFHPCHGDLIAHGSSRGIVRICDLRAQALVGRPVSKYSVRDPNVTRSTFFSEIISSLSDVKFSPDGQFILTRDYMNLRLWDVRIERGPVLYIPVHEHLRGRLCDLYETDCIFDKFRCAFSSNGGSLITGSYDSSFQSYSAFDGTGSAVEVSLDYVSGVSKRHDYSAENPATHVNRWASPAEITEPRKRIISLDVSPQDNLAAVGAGPAVYIYQGITG